MKTVLYSDREENTQAQQERKEPVIEFTPEQTEVISQPEKPAKNNTWVWVVVAIVVMLIIVGLVYYMNMKKRKENGTTERTTN